MSDKKGKKKDKKDEAGGPTEGTAKPAVAMDPVLVDMYELKIKDLLEKIDRAKEKQKALQTENEMLLKAQTKSVSEKQDIVEFLRIELANHEKTLAETEDKLAALDREKQTQSRMHADQYESLTLKTRDEREQLQHKIAKLTTDLAELSEFRGRKDAMERELQELEAELEEKERAFRAESAALERKFLQDKHVLKREMMAKVTDAVSSFRKVADTQMAETTKRAIRENLMATSQLRKMAGKTAELLAENEQLRAANASLRIETEVLNAGQKELAKKNAGAYQLIRRLVAKLDAAKVPIDKEDVRLAKGALPHADWQMTRNMLDALVIPEYDPTQPTSMSSSASSSAANMASPIAPGKHRHRSSSSSSREMHQLQQQVRQLESKCARTDHQSNQMSSTLKELARELQSHVYYRVLSATPTRSSSPKTPDHRQIARSDTNSAQPPTQIVPKIVNRFLHDLQSNRISVQLHFPRPSSPVPGRLAVPPGGTNSLVASPARGQATSSAASPDSSILAYSAASTPMRAGGGAHDGEEHGHYHATSTRKVVGLDVVRGFTPRPESASRLLYILIEFMRHANV
ncbi:hypothetical protein BCR44DRAFT_31170 [Catenaria anguillulae PL171]|uniref:Cilia- and flagella-associated protein 157 n=1 Tax=Catenaria anguillulae PL171 TaxID=765915 RepID=A0A1Y2HKM2_9FUNG|nr:hypothetical protein BCR44DRAFT_31170 [Catenaria anguillulae PL171]